MEVSVVIPIYNSSSYLEDCLKSIECQTFQSWECILVDDGSSDGCGEICDKWSQKDGRFHVIHQENGGVSKARNEGIKNAKGKYVVFIDSDDWVQKDYIDKLFSLMIESDWVLSGEEYCRVGISCRRKTLDDELLSIDDLKNQKVGVVDTLTSPHGKFYKRSIIEKYRIRFDQNLSIGEDRDFNMIYLNHVSSVKTTSYVGYCYNEDVENSLSKKAFDYLFEGDIEYWNKLHLFLGEQSINYQVHRLFNIIIDDCVMYGNRYGWVKAFKEIRRLRPIINILFLKKNINCVVAPWWQKVFVCNFL